MVLKMRLLLILGVIVATIAIVANSALAANSGGTRPGWGFGDKNHVHTGPPGQSVHP